MPDVPRLPFAEHPFRVTPQAWEASLLGVDALLQRVKPEFRARCASQLLPELDAFAPDLVFISAGFDGHADDFYHWLVEEDYAWLTERLVEVAEKHAGGRIVSVR